MAGEQYYVRIRGKINGPFDLAGLQKLAARGVVSRLHEVSADKITWTSASEYEQLFPSVGGRGASSAVAEETEDDGEYGLNTPPLPAPAPQYPPPPSAAGAPSAYAATTAHTPGYPNVGYQPVGYAAPPMNVGKSYSGMATASLVLSLVGLILFGFILGTLAVIFSSVALAGMGRHGNSDGKGRAIAGLIIGIIDVVVGILMMMYFMGQLK